MDTMVVTIRTPNGILKFVEILLTIIILAILRGGKIGLNFTDVYLAAGACVAYLLITPAFVVGYFVQEHPIRIEMLLNSIGSVLFFINGVLLFDHFSWYNDNSVYDDEGRAAASASIINSVVYAVDTFFAFKMFRSSSL